MASNSVHVADAWQALQPGGAYPGAFTPDGGAYVFPPIETVSASGKKRYWQVFVQVRGADGRAVAFNSAALLAQPVPALAGHSGVITTNSWQEGGEARQGGVPTHVTQGKNAGKKNATNVATQALRDALGLHNRQLKAAGQRGGPEAGGAGAGTGAGAGGAGAPPPRPLPMLVKKVGETRDATLTPATFEKGVVVQAKINGVRMVAMVGGAGAGAGAGAGGDEGGSGGAVFYSRKAGTYPAPAALQQQVGELLACGPAAWTMLTAELKWNPWKEAGKAAAGGKDAPAASWPQAPALYLDGESYKHGKSLPWISGASRSAQRGEELEYWVYDCFFPRLAELGCDVPSAFRQRYLDVLFLVWGEKRLRLPAGGGSAKVVRLPNHAAADEAAVYALARQFLADGFEGAIVRKNDRGYRYGKNNYHSSNLLKIKPLYDAEFAVVGYSQGARGKDVGAVIWECVVPAAQAVTGKDERFSVVPKLPLETRYRIFRNLGQAVPGADGRPTTRFERDFLGRPLTVEYPELSAKTGVPTQAKAVAFRTYEPGPGEKAEDPVGRLLAECP